MKEERDEGRGTRDGRRAEGMVGRARGRLCRSMLAPTVSDGDSFPMGQARRMPIWYEAFTGFVKPWGRAGCIHEV